MPQTGKFGLLFQKKSAQTQKGFEFILSGPNRQFDLGLSQAYPRLRPRVLGFIDTTNGTNCRNHRNGERSSGARSCGECIFVGYVHPVGREAASCFRHSARSAALAPDPCAMVIPIGCDFIWVDRMRASRDASRFRSMGLALAAQRPWGWGAQRRVCSPRMRDGEALGAHIPQVDWGSFASPVAEKC